MLGHCLPPTMTGTPCRVLASKPSVGSHQASRSRGEARQTYGIVALDYYVYTRRVLFFFTHIYFPASGQAMVTGVVPSPPRLLTSIFIAHRVQQSHCSSIFHRVLLTHALALSASQFVHKKKSQRIYTSTMHSGGFELTKLTHTRLEDNLIRHRGERSTRHQVRMHTSDNTAVMTGTVSYHTYDMTYT